MNENQIRAKWAQQKGIIVAWAMLGSPETSRILAQSGVDAVVLDWQHGLKINEVTIVECIESICRQEAVAPLVRVPSINDYQISHVLDAGACGVLVPMVSTPEEATRAVNACKYAPVGQRSLGLMPHQIAGESITNYVKRANQEIICMVMIETKEGVNNIEEICSVTGLDGVYIGPYDLSLDMGIPSEQFLSHPKHIDAVQKIFDAAKNRGIVAGHHGFKVDDTLKWIEMGSLFSQFGSDLSFIHSAAQINLNRLKNKKT
mgnify:CR=1 FL=1